MGVNKNIRKTKLSNGLVVVSETIPHVRSISFGVFLRTGSRHETPERNGISHFIEHALFKGTRKRSTAQIAEESDALGGHLDAFTGKEIVGFHDKVIDEHMPRAFELMADLITAPAFDRTELDKERNVILEEIRMVEDMPDDLVFEIFAENYYPDHALGRPILGTPETLATFAPPRVRAHYQSTFAPANLVLAAAGNITHAKLVAMARKYFGHLRPGGKIPPATTPRPRPHVTLRHKKELEQTHLVLGCACPSITGADRYTAYLLSAILGGGMSSRLFQSVREEHGLVYTVFSMTSSYVDCGQFNIYAAASRDNLQKTLAEIMDQLRRIKAEPVSAAELQRNKDQLKASLILNLESSSSRMHALAQQEIQYGRFIPLDDVVRHVDEVSAENILRLANDIFLPDQLALAMIGNLRGVRLRQQDLQC
ncbi:MAG: M16 family metallopeptidase [Blastocatellia bacterium]